MMLGITFYNPICKLIQFVEFMGNFHLLLQIIFFWANKEYKLAPSTQYCSNEAWFLFNVRVNSLNSFIDSIPRISLIERTKISLHSYHCFLSIFFSIYSTIFVLRQLREWNIHENRNILVVCWTLFKMKRYFDGAQKKTQSGYLICVVPMCETKKSTTPLKTFEFPSDIKRRLQWISAIVNAST